jgi:hypothetical protein
MKYCEVFALNGSLQRHLRQFMYRRKCSCIHKGAEKGENQKHQRKEGKHIRVPKSKTEGNVHAEIQNLMLKTMYIHGDRKAIKMQEMKDVSQIVPLLQRITLVGAETAFRVPWSSEVESHCWCSAT